MISEDIQKNIFKKAEKLGWKIATAESCTGGMIAARLTDPPMASGCVSGGIVTYSNMMKMALLKVPASCIETYGAVSDETVAAMAQGCLEVTEADVAISVSGIAGPSGATEDKPLGTVHFGLLAKGESDAQCAKVIFDGDRADVREQATDYALNLLAEKLDRELSLKEES